MDLKKAIITGASSGIGWATAHRLASEGMELILLARRAERLEKLKKELVDQHGIQVECVTADVRRYEDLEKLSKQNDWSGADVLINNAGLALGTDRMQNANISDWDGMIDTNVKGLLYITRLVLPHFVKNGRGHIVNLGSVAGRWVYPGGGIYCATKFAVRAISEGLRMDLIGTPIRVTNIEPGLVETEFAMVRLKDEEKAKSTYQGMQPLSSNDIADCVHWSLSRPAHVNIQELVIFPVSQPAVGQVDRK
jgi:NADP-dependent 3-hydroxy acid dehydrogenase YdfG